MGKTVKLNPRVRSKYKYNLNREISLLPRTLTIKKLIQHLASSGVSRDEFYSDRSIELGSDKSIPSDRLMIYAQVFDCETTDLINHEVKAVSIRDALGKQRARAKTSIR